MRTHEVETTEKSILLEGDGPYLEARLVVDSAPEAAREEMRKKFTAFWKDAIETLKGITE